MIGNMDKTMYIQRCSNIRGVFYIKSFKNHKYSIFLSIMGKFKLKMAKVSMW